MIAQALAGVATALKKMSSKSARKKIIAQRQEGKLGKGVAISTRATNNVKGGGL